MLLATFATAVEAPALPQPENLPPISTEMLRNATYSGIYDAPITLNDGRYEGESFEAGDPCVSHIQNTEQAKGESESL